MTQIERADFAERIIRDPFAYRDIAAKERAAAIRDFSQGVVRFFRGR